MVDQAAADLGGLDVLVNNAGIYLWHPITEVSVRAVAGRVASTLAVNLTGAANVTWCAVQHMKEARRPDRQRELARARSAASPGIRPTGPARLA